MGKEGCRSQSGVPIPRTAEEIKSAVRKQYAKRAAEPPPCCTPPERLEALQNQGYSIEEIADLPASVICRSCGGRNLLAFAEIAEGDTVLDLGCGAGLDCFLAARRVGSSGKVIGLDMTPEMLANAEESRRKLGAANVEFRKGEMEKMPVEDESVDVVISNGVICLSPDKDSVLREAFRVLKPAGRLAIVDLVFEGDTRDVPPSDVPRTGPGAPLMGEKEYLANLRAAGFEDVEVVDRSHPRQENKALVTIKARKLKLQKGESAMTEPATERTKAIARYEDLRYGMFIHFTMNTFLDQPFWATMEGPLPPSERYSPTELDVDQWITVANRAGMRYAVLIAKHYLGFALWNSKYTDYDVSTSGNRTDVVAEFVKACHKHGVAPCLYYSLGVDVAHRRDKGMTEDEWYEHARNQITELLTNYGPITVFWFDGMGPVPAARLQQAYDTVKSLQPDCLAVVNHGHGSNGTRLRYWPTDVIGGERTLPPPEGHHPWMEHEGKTYYIPMEACNTSAQGTFSKGWFWDPGEQIKEVQRELLLLYQKTTSRGANLLLNVTIDREGKVPAATVERLLELGETIKGLEE